jgi:CRISPR-associated protein Cmr6
MSIAALPNYLDHDQLGQASPGQRFGLYFGTWSEDWTINSNEKTQALGSCCKLNSDDRERLDALQARQQGIALLQNEDCLARFMAVSTAPFMTGMGHEHPTENGFSFLSPYGLPYLPGSSIKGVVRAAARELCEGEWGDTLWGDQAQDAMAVLFGQGGEDDARRGALTFLDCIPLLPRRNPLVVEIMTPHQGHYYQADFNKSAQSLSPHESENPVPIAYLAVPPTSEFSFLVTCDRTLLTEGLLADDLWRRLLQEAFAHAFKWLGFGAKTSLGYGAMARDEKREQQLKVQQEEERARAAREKAKATMSENSVAIAEFIERCTARVSVIFKKDKPNTGMHTEAQNLVREALGSDSWTLQEKAELADAIEKWLPQTNQVVIKDERKKMKLRQLREPES